MIISGADKIDHIGMVVNDIEKAVALYRNVFGLTPWEKGIQENETGQKMVILPLQGTFLSLLNPPIVSRIVLMRCSSRERVFTGFVFMLTTTMQSSMN